MMYDDVVVVSSRIKYSSGTVVIIDVVSLFYKFYNVQFGHVLNTHRVDSQISLNGCIMNRSLCFVVVHLITG